MATSPTDLPVTYSDVTQAAQVLAGVAVRTPLLESSALNEQAGGRLLFKPETLQVTGSFKFRGAYNHISRLDASVKKTGVLAYSSGNHAQAVAYASSIYDTQSTIVMPKNAPLIKKINTKKYGADVIFYDENRFLAKYRLSK